jgi:TonB family protein
MGPVMKIMARCRDDLRKYWNIDPEKAATLKQRPTSPKPLASVFSSDDYPLQATRNGEVGDTAVVLLIDDKGKVADCMIEDTSNIATLDAMACFVIQDRAKFVPAIGIDGKPARSYLTQRIRWRLPN